MPDGTRSPAAAARGDRRVSEGSGTGGEPASARVVPPAADTWVDLTTAPLSAGPIGTWATTPDTGAVVTFCGTVRDHAPGRPGVTALTYEAWIEAARRRLSEVVDDTRARWPDAHRIAALHRTGRLEVGDVAVVVAVSSAHRDVAFAAAAHCIDTLKATVPLWKKETWSGGEEWGSDARPITEPSPVARPGISEGMPADSVGGVGGRAS